MIDRLEGLVLRVLRVPAAPEAPAGDPGSVRVFRASKRYFRLRLIRWGLGQVGAVVGFVAVFGVLPISVTFAPLDEQVLERLNEVLPVSTQLLVSAFMVLELIGVAVFLLQLPVTFAMVRLDWTQRVYMVTDRSLRVREGMRQVREMTMTFANVQELSVRQNPLQRLLGIADLRVRSAGGGSVDESSADADEASHAMHLAYFRGVDNAEEIRDLIRARLRAYEDAGLGDPDDTSAVSLDPVPTDTVPVELYEAARELAASARQLREAVEAVGAPLG